MSYRSYSYLLAFLLFINCTSVNLENNIPNLVLQKSYSNKGFALIYNEDLFKKKIISNKIDERSLIIFQKKLKKNSLVKITNILNNKSLLVRVGKKSDYPSFNNSVISIRIARELDLNIEEPYVQIVAISKDSSFIAKKAKIYEEEKKVANKAPVNNISINNLKENENILKKKPDKKFSYFIKIADFYFKDTALSMVERIKVETEIKKIKIEKLTAKNFRVYLGPYNNINSLQKSYNDINILQFENIEIIKND